MTEDEKTKDLAEYLAESFEEAMDAEVSDEAPLVCGLETPEICESCQ